MRYLHFLTALTEFGTTERVYYKIKQQRPTQILLYFVKCKRLYVIKHNQPPILPKPYQAQSHRFINFHLKLYTSRDILNTVFSS